MESTSGRLHRSWIPLRNPTSSGPVKCQRPEYCLLTKLLYDTNVTNKITVQPMISPAEAGQGFADLTLDERFAAVRDEPWFQP